MENYHKTSIKLEDPKEISASKAIFINENV